MNDSEIINFKKFTKAMSKTEVKLNPHQLYSISSAMDPTFVMDCSLNDKP